MEVILNNIYDLVDLLIKSDPAVYRVMLYDPNGTLIFSYSKTWNRGKKYTSVGPMIAQILNNANKFLGFMKNSFYDRFFYQWNFDNLTILCGDTNAGFICIFCEEDADLGFIKNILTRQGLPIFEKIMKPIIE
jgi:hypothetical protein